MVRPISWVPEVQGPTKVGPLRPEKIADRGDTFSISAEARSALRRQKDIQLAWKAINESPDIREDKVKLARERLGSGFYNQPDGVAAVAEKILESMGL